MSIKIALTGNPNSGKTTMFNDLTGSFQHVGNWPGVTVERKEGKLKGNKDVLIQDLPGIYSLSPYTLEEVIARDYLTKDKPDAIINIIDASNIERNLYLTTQLLELGIPVVVALNMMDVVKKNGDSIDKEELSKILGCEVVATSALKGEGTKQVAERAVALAKMKGKPQQKDIFSGEIEHIIHQIEDLVKSDVEQDRLRWTAIKLFERDEKISNSTKLSAQKKNEIEQIVVDFETQEDDDSESIITNARYEYISGILNQAVQKRSRGKLSPSDKIDQIVTNRWLALPIFALVMFLVYYISITTVGTMATDWANDVFFGEWLAGGAEGWLSSIGASDWLISLVVDGIIGGVGAVLGFLPQMVVLFFCLALLEDCGYMARIAFIMDRIFRKFGLSGKSFIPMLVATGCGVPAIMASRTIENENDRKMTIMTTTFIPCGAKLPIIALIAGALFDNAAWVATASYFIGIGAIIISGVILKKTKAFAGEASPFVMELPAYHAPKAKGVIMHMWERAKTFVIKAGTIIFVASVFIWLFSNFNFSMEMVDVEDSILASIGGVIAPIFAPLGWGDWKAAVAAITGLVAKENVVATFGILYGFAEVAEDGVEIWPTLQASFTQLAAFSFLIFNLLCAPCFAAIGAIKREMGSWKWMFIAIGYQTALAYGVALMVYQIGMFATGAAGFGIGTAVGIAILLVMLYFLFRPNRNQTGRSIRAVDRLQEAK